MQVFGYCQMVLHEIVSSTMLTQVYAWLEWIWQVDAYEAKKTELVAENADLRSMLRSMQVYICSSSKIFSWIMYIHFSGIWHNNHLKIAAMISYISNWFSVPWHFDISHIYEAYISYLLFSIWVPFTCHFDWKQWGCLKRYRYLDLWFSESTHTE